MTNDNLGLFSEIDILGLLLSVEISRENQVQVRTDADHVTRVRPFLLVYWSWTVNTTFIVGRTTALFHGKNLCGLTNLTQDKDILSHDRLANPTYISILNLMSSNMRLTIGLTIKSFL